MTTATQPRADKLGLTTEELQDYYDYLDELRESGETNMFGASAYLMEDWDLGRRAARDILGAWMTDFGS
jgi:hypothetical protein